MFQCVSIRWTLNNTLQKLKWQVNMAIYSRSAPKNMEFSRRFLYVYQKVCETR